MGYKEPILSEAEHARMRSALQLAATHYTACGNACSHEPRYCGCFWKKVFTLYYGSDPQGDSDTRWDPLFNHGYFVHRHEHTIHGGSS